jgi:hypothetical protein
MSRLPANAVPSPTVMPASATSPPPVCVRAAWIRRHRGNGYCGGVRR